METFNLLLGLRVNQQLTFTALDRTYTVVNGIRGKQRVVVIWRSTIDMHDDDEMLLKEKTFLTTEVLPSLRDAGAADIYANDVCLVEGSSRIEAEFKRLMFGAK